MVALRPRWLTGAWIGTIGPALSTIVKSLPSHVHAHGDHVQKIHLHTSRESKFFRVTGAPRVSIDK